MNLAGNLTEQEIQKLCEPFPDERLCVKPQSISKDKRFATLVLYLQHTDVMTRLDEVDPNWCNRVERMDIEKVEKKNAYTGEPYQDLWVVVHMGLTIKGVTRYNCGEGNTEKAAYSDALKRCAMLFGIGRWLYDVEVVRAQYNEETDKFKQWTLEDYRAAEAYWKGANQKKAPPTKPTQTPVSGVSRPMVKAAPKPQQQPVMMDDVPFSFGDSP